MEKLVRDKIPEIIRSEGKEPKVRIALGDNEYFEFLRKKLVEEAQEFLQNPSLLEFCDVMEVIEAILNLQGVSIDEIEDAGRKKREERGGFSERYIMKFEDKDDNSKN